MSAPSEAVTWKRIGVPDRTCRRCHRRLKLIEVGHFGTADGVRFVECKPCVDGPKAR